MTARGALTIVGQVVGAFVGGPFGAAVGGAIGGAIGGEIDGPQQAQGPRLADTKVPNVGPGLPMPYLEGTQRLALNPLWVSAVREIATTTSHGGKGADTTTDVTTYTYEVDALFWVTANPIGGVTRIWDAGRLVYSLRDADGALNSRAADLWDEITVYTGAADQLPDPTYEAAVGVGNAPAYRQRGTIMLRGLVFPLPHLTAEVATSIDTERANHVIVTVPNPNSNGELVGPIYAATDGIVVHMGSSHPSGAGGVQDITVRRLGFDGSILDLLTYAAEPHAMPAGQADSSVVVLPHNADQSIWNVIDATGTTLLTAALPPEIGLYGARSRFHYRGGVLVACPTEAGMSKVVYKITADGTLTTSATLADWPQSLAITADAIYALKNGGGSIYVLHLTALTLTTTITTPSTENTSKLLVSEDGVLHYLDSTSLHAYAGGSSWTLLNDTFASNGSNDERGASSGWANHTIAADGTVFRLNRLPPSSPPYEHDLLGNVQIQAPQTVDLADAVSRQCQRAGLSVAQIDASALHDTAVRGFAVTQATPVRQTLTMLAEAYLFEGVESAAVLKFVRRGGAVARSISVAHLGASHDAATEPLPTTRESAYEKPARLTIRYANAVDDYQDGAETSDRLVDTGAGVQVRELPLVLSPDEAKQLAEVLLTDLTARRYSFSRVALNNDHVALEPTDVVEWVDADANRYRARLQRLRNQHGVNEFDSVLDDATALTSSATTDTGPYTDSLTVNTPAGTTLELLDIPILRDADDYSGMYAAAKGTRSPWPGASLEESADDVTFTPAAEIAESAVIGVTTSALDDWSGGRVWDEVSTVRVDVGAAALTSSTRDAMLDDQTINAFLIGAEIVQARTATLVSSGVYDLSGFLRGGRGTEHAQTDHTAAERVVKLQTAGLRRFTVDTNRIGIDRYYRGRTLGRNLNTAATQTVADNGVDRMPFAPIDLRISRDGSNNATLTWQRRTRLQVRTIGPLGISIPLGEESESYSIDVLANDTDETVVRTLTSSTPTVAYSAANQTSDGLTPGDPIRVRVYQLSAIVGRGYPLEATA